MTLLLTGFRGLSRPDVNLRVCWTRGKSLKDTLVRSAYKPRPCPGGGRRCHACLAGLVGRCHEKNVVYKIECKICPGNVTYVGESRRSVRVRFGEHIADARNKRVDTPLGDHQLSAHPNRSRIASDFCLSIIHHCKDGPDRKILESIAIRDIQQSLNTKQSWPLI